MQKQFSTDKIINQIREIFKRHEIERICVVGTMCCGKTTLVKQLTSYGCIDMDDEFWPTVTTEELDFYSRRPFTKEMSDSLYKMFCERVIVKAGNPTFGVYILDCDVVVYLDIDEKTLKKHCIKRGDTDFTDAKNLKSWIEDDLNQLNTKTDIVFYHLVLGE